MLSLAPGVSLISGASKEEAGLVAGLPPFICLGDEVFLDEAQQPIDLIYISVTIFQSNK